MAAASCLVLYGNSVFLAGIRADLLGRTELEMITIEPGCPDALNRIEACRPLAVLFDLATAQPDFAVTLLRKQPDLLLIGVDPSSDEVLVLSPQRERALNIADLIKVIRRESAHPHPSRTPE